MATAGRRELHLTDPRAMRVLAHPIRRQVLEVYVEGKREFTATQAAERFGITPSAMSYHLRAMQKWGILERGESTDGRERPWRAAVDSITFTPDSPGGETERAALRGLWVESVSNALQRAAVAGPETHSTIAGGTLWLTEKEIAEVNADIDAVLERYRGRAAHDHPAGAEHRTYYWIHLPDPAED